MNGGKGGGLGLKDILLADDVDQAELAKLLFDTLFHIDQVESTARVTL